MEDLLAIVERRRLDIAAGRLEAGPEDVARTDGAVAVLRLVLGHGPARSVDDALGQLSRRRPSTPSPGTTRVT